MAETARRCAEGPEALLCGNAAGPSAVRWCSDMRGAAGRRRCGTASSYFTVTVLTAEVLDAPLAVTRTRILYLPFTAGAFHLSE